MLSTSHHREENLMMLLFLQWKLSYVAYCRRPANILKMIDNDITFKDKKQNTKNNSVLYALVEWLKKDFMVLIAQCKFGTP